MDKQHLNNFLKAPLVLEDAHSILAPHIEQLSQIFQSQGASLFFEEGSSNFVAEGVTEENWKSLMEEVNLKARLADRVNRLPKVRKFVEEAVGVKLKPFIINKLRINYPQLGKSRYNWHQDAATWPGFEEQYPHVKPSSIFTLWLSITVSDEGNGLEIASDFNEGEVVEHSFVDNQGYFNAQLNTDESNLQTTEVYGPSFTTAIFGQNIMHRSMSGGSNTRVSFDLRYYCE